MSKVGNNAANLRKLLTDLYVAPLAYIAVGGSDDGIPRVPPAAYDAMLTTVLDAAEGREFEPLKLPWPK